MPSILKTPNDFSKMIADVLTFKLEAVEEFFDVGEDKEGFFYATLRPKKWLSDLQFRGMCGLVRDLGGDYVKGFKMFRVPGPLAKKSPTPIQEETPKVAAGSSEASPKPSSIKISQSSELCIGALSEDEDVKALRGSSKKIGSLYPVLMTRSGEVIDGFHRLKADPDWPKFTVEGIEDPVQLAKARLISNERRNVSPEEKGRLLREIIVYTNWSMKQLAEELGWGISTVYRYLPDDLKDQTKAAAGALGGSDSALTLRAPDGKPVSVETVKPQDITYGKARELLDTPAGREVLIDAVKEAVAKGEIPVSLDKEEPLFAEGIATVEDEHEPLEGSEKSGVGSFETVHRHKIEGTQVGEFTCTECNQHFFIDHISADKHRLTKVRSAPE
jgi:ParB-like chromosome segregation protein Spo0J